MKKFFTLRAVAIALLLALGSVPLASAQILTFDFAGATGSEVTLGSNFNDARLTASTISRGAGVTAGANGDRFNSLNWTTAASIDATDYVEFTITPNAGKQFSITSVVMLHQRSGTGPVTFTIRSSADSYASDLTTPITIADVTTTQTSTFTFSVTNSTTARTYRIYAYSSEAGTGTWGPGDGTGNDIVVNGSTSDVSTDTNVSFATASANVSEGAGTYNVTVNITNPSGSQATGVDVVLISGNGARINGFTSQTISFPTSSSTPIDVTLTITDDALCNGDEVLTFALQNLTGGQGTPTAGANRTLTVQNNDNAVDVTATAASGVGYGDFTANWDAVSGATNYRLDVYTLDPVAATDLFFSEYVEGSSNNKYIEIYNGTGATADLTDYRLRIYANGAAAPTGDVQLAGTLADGATIVLRNASAVIYGGSTVVNAAVNFNGNDAMALFKISSGLNVDIFGRIGEDPGAGGWTAAGGRATTDKTLVRKASVIGGITTNPGSGFPTLLTEWDVFNIDDVTHLGAHTFNGTTITYVPGYQDFDAGTNTSQLVSGLSPLTAYHYVVRSTGGCSTGNNSNQINVSTIAVPTYYSRASGDVTDAIWSDTPSGIAGPAVFTAASNMVVQSPNVVTNTANATIKDLTVDAGGTLILNGSTTLDVKGTSAAIVGTLTANDNSVLSITEATNSALAITGTVSFYDLTAAPGGTVVVTGGVDIRGTLQLDNGVFDASGATVTLRSFSTGTGRLGPVDAGASYTGNITVQRRIPGGATNWRFLGSPVGSTSVSNWQDDFITAGYPGSQYPNFDDPVGSGILWPSIRKYNETNTGTTINDGLVGVGSSAESLGQGRGYAAWSGDMLGGTSPFMIDLTGAPNVANTPIDLPMSWTDTGTPTVDGWNFVSNPVASPLVFSSISRGTDVGDFITYYNPATGNTAVYDISLGFGTNGATNLIQSSQGFFLKATGPAVTTSVDEGDKTIGNGGGMFGGDEENATAALHLTITSAINDYNDETAVLFSTGAPEVDQEDALKYVFAVPAAPQIATMSGTGELIAINAYGPYSTAISIPVMVDAGVSGTYTVTATGSGTLGLTCLSLEDLLTGEVTPLGEGATYSFEMDAEADASAPRLMLHATVPLAFEAQDATCGDTANGQATVVITEGPADVTWTDEFGAVLSQQTGVVAGDVTFGGLAAGSYMVHVTSNTVCGELVSEFTIDAPFVLEAATVSSNATSCADAEDGSIDVMVMGGVEPYSYAWSNGAGTEDLVAGAGSYTLTVTDANNCEWVSDVFTIEAGGATAGFTVENPVVLVNTDVIFTNTSVSGETFFWEFGDGITSTEMEPVHAYMLPGVYTVTLTVTSGDCADVTSFDVTVELNTGISTRSVVGVSAWVSTSSFVVEHGFTSGLILIEVLDVTGGLHATRQVAATPGRVNLPNEGLSTGIWFVRVTNGDSQQTFRLPLVR